MSRHAVYDEAAQSGIAKINPIPDVSRPKASSTSERPAYTSSGIVFSTKAFQLAANASIKLTGSNRTCSGTKATGSDASTPIVYTPIHADAVRSSVAAWTRNRFASAIHHAANASARNVTRLDSTI